MSTKVYNAGELVTQFSILLENRVGALAGLVRMLRANRMEIVGISMQDSRDASVVRIVVTDPDRAKEFLIKHGFAFAHTGLLVVALRESGPDLLDVLEALMAAETNIDFAYSLLPFHDGQAALAMHVEDAEFAWGILNRAGFKFLTQEDLSR